MANENTTAIIEIESADHLAQVLAGGRGVIIDFGAQWCGPCRAIAAALPKLEPVLVEREVVVAKVDADRFGNIAEQYGVRGLPTLVYVSAAGTVLQSRTGAVDYLKLKTEIEAQYALPVVVPAAVTDSAPASV